MLKILMLSILCVGCNIDTYNRGFCICEEAPLLEPENDKKMSSTELPSES